MIKAAEIPPFVEHLKVKHTETVHFLRAVIPHLSLLGHNQRSRTAADLLNVPEPVPTAECTWN